ncbi:rhodanese-like domain-containing protein [Saprospira grandis]|uniref:Rhodanese-related sulfurtransferase n=1 Tax=Saprospira grandis DSM 2844 TaxID=694433 RepID=J1I572_9BACT|nr:rhodanese-like domain-containing protein [Saprospira grandis]EJF53523.1 Rhodanese-related sulfurtransferase [Saprospira grandis DSM 2844]WBM75898.1 rhodanese-like domain-containing protein [Saprospira grandis]
MEQVKAVNVQELKRMQDDQFDFQLIDLREADELEICHINGTHIPLGEIDVRAQEIARDKPVVLHCKTGRRSYMAALFLQQQHGFDNLYSLDGGIIAYAKEIDPNMTAY